MVGAAADGAPARRPRRRRWRGSARADAVEALESGARVGPARRPVGRAIRTSRKPARKRRGRGQGVTALPRAQLADELLRRFAASLRSDPALFEGPSDHRPESRGRCRRPCSWLHGAAAVDRSSASSTTRSSSTTRRRKPKAWAASSGGCSQIGVERITIDRGVTTGRARDADRRRHDARATVGRRAARRSRRCRTSASGASRSDRRAESGATDMATFKRLYTEAVSVAQTVWDSAATEGAARRHRRRGR